MIDKRDDDFLETNIKGLMMTLLARWNQEMDAARAETEFAGIRPADMRVFGQLRGREVPLSALHRELSVSRQAAQQAIERLVAHGVVRVDAAEGSRRDKVVSVTEKGQRWRAIAAAEIRRIEVKVAEVVGEDGREDLRRLLVALAKDSGGVR